MPNMTELTIPEMWYKIHNHHKFVNSILGVSLLIGPVMVNPATKRIEDDRSTNTELNYWIEFLVPQPITEANRIHYGARTYEAQHHDYELDCGGVTHEEAIRKAYHNFINKYGETNDELYLKALRDQSNKYVPHTISNLKSYFFEDVFSFDCIKKDIEFLNKPGSFEETLKHIITRYCISPTQAVEEPHFYFIYKNDKIDSNFEAECIVNYEISTYKIKKNSNLDYESCNAFLKILFRIYNIKYAEVLFNVETSEFLIYNVEKTNETTI